MKRILAVHCLMLVVCCVVVRAQDADRPRPGGPGGPGGAGGDRFMGGGPPGMGQQIELLKKFDKDGDKKLNKDERKEAREYLAKEGGGRRRGGFGGFGGRGNQEPPQPGEKLTPGDVKS